MSRENWWGSCDLVSCNNLSSTRYKTSQINQPPRCFLLFWCKPRLDFLNLLGSNLEGLGQDMVWNRWSGSKQGCSNGLCPWKLAIEGWNHRSRNLSIVLLEVKQAFWEHKYVTLVNGLWYEHIGCGYEPHI